MEQIPLQRLMWQVSVTVQTYFNHLIYFHNKSNVLQKKIPVHSNTSNIGIKSANMDMGHEN